MKSNLKLVGIKMRHEGDKDILETTLREKEKPCKKCKKNNRVHGSSYCRECSHQHKLNKINDGRLQEKISKQINSKVL